nr:tRNA pseudouridine(38-40) synthase TruA [Quadrisphaera sp. DSM 44207]
MSYDGTDFAGWARQPGLRTVQGELEAALARVLRLPAPPATAVAGRTDAGVHATGQVCSVDLPAPAWRAAPGRSSRPPGQALRDRLGGVLPPDVLVRSAAPAPAGFDARFSALRRRYAYRVGDDPAGVPPLRRRDVVGVRAPAGALDVAAMDRAAAALVGLHDFAAYCRPRSGATTVRTLLRCDWRRDADGLVVATVVADAFCHSMVRALVGALLAVGQARRPVEWPERVLRAGVRDGAVQVAPARGLVLEAVDYPPDEQLAERARAARSRRDAPAGPWQGRSMTEQPRQSDAERFDPRATDDDLEERTVASEPQDHDGVLETGDINDDRVTGAEFERGYTTEERPSPLFRHGLTAEEEHRGETLEDRLAQEEPDAPAGSGGAIGADGPETPADEPDDGELLDDQVGYERAGRIVEPDAGAGTDTEKDAVAQDVGLDGGQSSAEEAAMHVVPEPTDPEAL